MNRKASPEEQEEIQRSLRSSMKRIDEIFIKHGLEPPLMDDSKSGKVFVQSSGSRFGQLKPTTEEKRVRLRDRAIQMLMDSEGLDRTQAEAKYNNRIKSYLSTEKIPVWKSYSGKREPSILGIMRSAFL